jgi:hypothetical protein
MGHIRPSRASRSARADQTALRTRNGILAGGRCGAAHKVILMGGDAMEDNRISTGIVPLDLTAGMFLHCGKWGDATTDSCNQRVELISYNGRAAVPWIIAARLIPPRPFISSGLRVPQEAA